LKNGSPLGIEPKGEGISGASGFSTGSGTTTPAVNGETPKKAQAPEAPAPKPAEKKENTAPTGAAAKLTP
jgi:hypothetical protein